MKNDRRETGKRLFHTMFLLKTFVIIFLLLTSSLLTAAEKFPVRPVRFIIPYATGGNADISIRIMAPYIQKHLGQPLLIENLAGAGTVQGEREVMTAKPDGYTILTNSRSMFTAYYTIPGAPHYSEFEPVALIYRAPVLLGVSEKSGFKSLKELVAFAKKNPKKLTAAINVGALSQYQSFGMMKAIGIEVTSVPFKGGGERSIALAGGHIDINVDTLSALQSYLDAKKIRVLGIAAEQRNNLRMEISTFREQGVDLVMHQWAGIFTPKGTPADVIQTLETAFKKTSQEKALIEQLGKYFVDVVFMNREEFSRYVISEDASTKEITKELGIGVK